MAYAFVKSSYSDGSGSSTTVVTTFGSAVSAGNALLVGLMYTHATTAATALLADTLLNTYTEIGSGAYDSASGAGLRLFYAKNIAGGTPTVTATFGAAATFRGLYVAEYSGLDTSAPLITSAMQVLTNPGTGTDAITSGTANVTSQPALIWAFGYNWDNSTALSVGTGFTSRDAGLGVSNLSEYGHAADKRVTATGNQAGTFTSTAGGSAHFPVAFAAFAETGAGGGGASVRFKKSFSVLGTKVGKRQVI